MVKDSAMWKRVKFGEVAECVNDRVDDPKAAGVDRYVGLEHLDSGSLAIQRWGTPDDVESMKLRFKPGDIIFGKRRAYQRKLAVADFKGICSAHAMVLRAKPKTVLPEFLPFFMQSDVFMERAVAISVGSLSPTINWKTLAAEEFALPPLDQQRRIVPVLASCMDVLDSAAALVQRARTVVRSTLDAAFGFPRVPRRELVSAPDGWTVQALATLADPNRPISYGILLPGDSVADGVPMLRIMDVDDFGRRTTTQVMRVARAVADTSATTYARRGDLVVSVMATIGRSFVVTPEMDGWNMNRALTLIPCASESVAKLLHAYFQSGFVQRLLGSEKIGSAQARINLADLKTLPVPIPPVLNEVVDIAEGVFAALRAAEERHLAASALGATLRKQVLA